MDVIVLMSILSVLIGCVAAITQFIRYSYSLKKKRADRTEVSPAERIQQSISKLSTASQEIDTTIQDIIQEIERRQVMLEDLRARHQILSQEEAEVSKRVETLKGVQLEVANYFQQISEEALQQVEKKRARRDVLMFVLGIVVTTVVSIILLRVLGEG